MPSRSTAPIEPGDLALVQEQLPRPAGLVVEAVGLQIFRDIGVVEPELAAALAGIGIGDVAAPLAQRLHLGAGQRDAGLEGLADLIVEARPPVGGGDLRYAAFPCLAAINSVDQARMDHRRADLVAASAADTLTSGRRTSSVILPITDRAYLTPRRDSAR